MLPDKLKDNYNIEDNGRYGKAITYAVVRLL